MKLFHTSPEAIAEIHDNGRFGQFLFFSDEVYVMTAGDYTVHSIEIDEDDIIEAGQLFYHEDAEKLAGLVAQVMEMVGCDEDTAEELISQHQDVHSIECDIEPEDLADASWDIQRITAEAALVLGYRGVEVEDEQGAAYMIAVRADELVVE